MRILNRDFFSARFARRLTCAVILLLGAALSGAHAGEVNAQASSAASAVSLPQALLTPLTLVSLSPVIANGQTLGAIAIYDDPMTPRPADYLELLNSAGAIVMVSWFDEFGIERLAVDRSLIEGGQELEGVFVAVLSGEVL